MDPLEEWYVIDDGLRAPAYNMAADEALLESVSNLGRPVLRFYGWTPAAATFGYFQKYVAVAGWTSLRPLIRRPTGGGLVPHDGDWTYTVVIPPGHFWYSLRARASYQRLHEWIQASLRRLELTTDLAPIRQTEGVGQCFVGAEEFDLMHEGRKIAGAAQRRNRLGLLIQGSLQPGSAAKMRHEAWKHEFCALAEYSRCSRWLPFSFDSHLQARASFLEQNKYSQVAYNQGR